MGILLKMIFLALALVVTKTTGQAYTLSCGVALEDIPDPASESCVAFYRCYQNRQYSIRCPLGQAFHFDRVSCRPETEVDCPLQLQRFQAPAVPHHLRPAQAQQDREIQIRVVHVGPNTAPNNGQVNNVGSYPVLTQTASQVQPPQGHSPPSAPQLNIQPAPFFFRTSDGHVIQAQGFHNQGGQGQVHYAQPPVQQGHPVQGQNIPTYSQQNSPGQMAQGQNFIPPSQQSAQSQPNQGQIPLSVSHGQSLSYPSQQHVQGQTVQGQTATGQSVLNRPQQGVQVETIQGQTSKGQGQTNQGQTIQGQAYQGQTSQVQTSQGQNSKGTNIPSSPQGSQIQTVQNQAGQGQINQGLTVQDQNISPPSPQNSQGQPTQGQVNQDQIAQGPSISPSSSLTSQGQTAQDQAGQTIQGQNILPPQKDIQSQSAESQTTPSPIELSSQGHKIQIQNLASQQSPQEQLDGQSNLSIFSPSYTVIGQNPGGGN